MKTLRAGDIAAMKTIHRRGVIAGAGFAAVACWQAARAGDLLDFTSPGPSPLPAAETPAPLNFANPQASVPATAAGPRWRRFAVAAPSERERPGITIVIDDLGVMRAPTERVLALNGPLTLSWFPFAHRLPEQVAAGSARGHEATLHMPMQSFGKSEAWTGPDPLRVDLPPEVNLARLRAAIEAVPDTVGLNNHMGSVSTHDPALMALVALEALAHNMLFLDSVVIPHSQGIIQARQVGTVAAARDVFIDHSNKPEDIREQLGGIEAYARKHGDVIAIGHPWPHTIAALEEWLPTLDAKGFTLWPLSAMVARRSGLALPA